jgi:hypothetical protein
MERTLTVVDQYRRALGDKSPLPAMRKAEGRT